jgi:hypothetical protein
MAENVRGQNTDGRGGTRNRTTQNDRGKPQNDRQTVSNRDALDAGRNRTRGNYSNRKNYWSSDFDGQLSDE